MEAVRRLVRRVARAGSRVLARAASLVLPVTCAGCGAWETRLCGACRRALSEGPVMVDHADGAGSLRVVAASWYTGAVRVMVLAWKNGARQDLAPVMAAAAQRAARQWMAGLDGAARERVRAGGLLVVPAPSGVGRRLQGRLVAAEVADAVAAVVADELALADGLGRDGGTASARTSHEAEPPTRAPSGTEPPAHVPGGAPMGGTPVARALPADALPADTLPARTAAAQARAGPWVLSADVLRRPPWSPSHQAGRSARERRASRARVPRVLADVSGWQVVLVDDVVTTGATLGSCARALADAGATCLGAVTVAAAPPPAPEPVSLADG